jgi:nucleoside-diphosphate-sugar epimerase
LVTGSEGGIGRALVPALVAAGHEPRTLDRVATSRCPHEHHPADLRDLLAVRRAVQGVEAVLHLGAVPNDDPDRADEVLTVNVQGTWNVLLACVEAGVGRLVAFSSINALGNVGGHRPSAFLPIDDAYPRHPVTPYQLSKLLAEESCAAFTRRHGIVTLCLRPALVAFPDRHYPAWRRASGEELADRFRHEYWSYVDVRDVCAAAILSLTAPGIDHGAYLLGAADAAAKTPTADLVARHYPDTPWPVVDRDAYLADRPFRSLLDCSRAASALGWRPRYGWRDEA